ncbi:hypothetical protein DH2020_027159 [Rehmannia glutinosa]|uniref:Small ribosomal subunit protein uS7 domain-containing protein n=1 Tax=Rehmannia glutinosa TaxID=99300 RepID=A0ABR0VWU2_REHGL
MQIENPEDTFWENQTSIEEKQMKGFHKNSCRIENETETNPLSVLRQAICGVTPDIAVKARRVGGSAHQVPIEIGSTQGKALAIRWLLAASQKCSGRNMAFKLSSELVDAAKGSGDAIRKKEETHKMAEANRAFAHFR